MQLLTDMSSNTLSAAVEKQIRSLCLNDFPCGNGTWKQAKEGSEGAPTEQTDALLDLLSCPHSPWRHDDSWSPQAPALREMAVLTPERLQKDFIYNFFTTLRIIDNNVSIIDSGLLKFSKLEELVLSANKISEIPSENLPSTLKILELHANRLSALNSLTNHPPPHLQYLGLGSNSLGSRYDMCYLTGRHWPQLVCLDLSDCDFQDQRALLDALSTLPCLRTLVLQGNPFTLAPSYPGLTVDSLPQLCCLDAAWVPPEERRGFRGLAEKTDLNVDRASATVRVGRLRGLPDPEMSLDENADDFPVITYSYSITYEFLSHQSVNLKSNGESDVLTEDCFSEAELQSEKNYAKESPKVNTQEETCHEMAHVSKHSTSKLLWSECMDFSYTQKHTVCDLGHLKRFFNQGLYLSLEEEKVLSWPAATEEVLMAKPSRTAKDKKGGKGKESRIKSGSTKDKSKDKKKKSVPELLQDAPIRRVLGSVHVPLQNLVKTSQKVNVLCDLGVLHAESEVEAAQTLGKASLQDEKDQGKKIKEDKKKDKDSKRRGGSGTKQKNTSASKAKGKGRKECETVEPTEDRVSVQLEPVTVELSVELEKWRSASEAH